MKGRAGLVISKEFVLNLIDEKANFANKFLLNSSHASIHALRNHFNQFHDQISKDIQILPFTQFIQKILKLQRDKAKKVEVTDNKRMRKFVKVLERLTKLKAERNLIKRQRAKKGACQKEIKIYPL